MPRNVPSKASSRSPAKSAAQRSGRTKTTENDVLGLLAADHKNVTKMFEQFEKMKKDGDDESKQKLVERACAALTLHARLEEEIFYPVARETLEDADVLLDEAQVEHACAKQLITELNAMRPGDELYEAKFTVLGEYVKHHIEEEEKQIFPKMKKTGIDLESMAEELRHRRAELREELGMMDEEAEQEEEQSAPKSHRRVH